VGELDAETCRALSPRADAWRNGTVERGFSMALGRLADRVDARVVVVLARDADERLRGLLQLVPWGCEGCPSTSCAGTGRPRTASWR
jgi:lysyl-tRNA synthetase class 2